MFNLVVLSALLAVAVAAPSRLGHETFAWSDPLLTKTVLAAHPGTILKTAVIAEPSHVTISKPAVAKVGEIVQSFPTAVSHQSSTVVHNRANIVTPIVAPAVKTITAPVLRTISAPVVAAPILKTISAPVLKTISAPVLKTISAPLAYPATHALPLTYGYAATAPIAKAIHAPLTYSVPLEHGW